MSGNVFVTASLTDDFSQATSLEGMDVYDRVEQTLQASGAGVEPVETVLRNGRVLKTCFVAEVKDEVGAEKLATDLEAYSIVESATVSPGITLAG